MRRLFASAVVAVSVTASGLVGLNAIGPANAAGQTCPMLWGFKPGGGFWRCTFSDEFNGTSLDPTKWSVQTTAASGFASKPACFVNSPNNVSVSGGTLNLTVRKEANPFLCSSPSGSFASQYTAGSVLTYGHFAQAYGRWEISAKFPAATVAGLQEALWMAPQNIAKYGAWPASGEIDIAEAYSALPDRAIPFVHYNAATVDMNVTNNYCMINNINAFHTYLLLWTKNYIQISFDGKTCITDYWNPASPLSKPQPFDQPFVLALTQALGTGANAYDPASTPLPATTQINFVHVWS